MQAIKEKLNDMSAMRKAKAEAKEEEKVEKELAKARVDIAHEVRLAREAEAAMDLHVNRAVDIAMDHERKYPHKGSSHPENDSVTHGHSPNEHSYNNPSLGSDTSNMGSTTSTGADYATARSSEPPSNIIL